MPRAALACLLLLLTTSPALARDAPEFDAAKMKQRFEQRLAPALEKALGRKLKKPVAIREGSLKDMTRLVARENATLLAEVEGGRRGFELEIQANRYARAVAPFTFGKVDIRTGQVLILPSAFRLVNVFGKDLERIHSQAFLDVVLLHEAVHAFQHQTWNLQRFFGQPTSEEQLQARLSVIEGHAQYVTRRAAKQLGLETELALLVRAVTRAPRTYKDEGNRMLAGVVAARTSAPYSEGEPFFRVLAEELGYEAAVKRVFTQPPTSMLEVSRPQVYLNPKATTKDLSLAQLTSGVGQLFDPKRYTIQQVTLSRTMLKATLALLEEKVRLQVLAGMQSGVALIGSPRAGTGSARIAVGMCLFDTPEQARRFAGVQRTVLRRKDDSFASSKVRIVAARYDDERIKGEKGVVVEKTLAREGSKVKLRVLTLITQRGPVSLELQVQVKKGGRKALLALASAVFALIDAQSGSLNEPGDTLERKTPRPGD